MQKAEAKIQPVLAAFKDQVLYLKHNLNASNRGIKAWIYWNRHWYSQLIRAMELTIAEASQFVAALTNQKAAYQKALPSGDVRVYTNFVALSLGSALFVPLRLSWSFVPCRIGYHIIPACIFFIACKTGVFPLLIKLFTQCNDFFRFFTVNSVEKLLFIFNRIA